MPCVRRAVQEQRRQRKDVLLAALRRKRRMGQAAREIAKEEDGMYQRDSKAMPGCITALVALSVAAYAVSLVAIGRAVAGLIK